MTDEVLQCEICCARFLHSKYIDHAKLPAHKSKLTESVEYAGLTTGSLTCRSCLVRIDSVEDWESHLCSELHIRRLEFMLKVGGAKDLQFAHKITISDEGYEFQIIKDISNAFVTPAPSSKQSSTLAIYDDISPERPPKARSSRNSRKSEKGDKVPGKRDIGKKREEFWKTFAEGEGSKSSPKSDKTDTPAEKKESDDKSPPAEKMETDDSGDEGAEDAAPKKEDPIAAYAEVFGGPKEEKKEEKSEHVEEDMIPVPKADISGDEEEKDGNSAEPPKSPRTVDREMGNGSFKSAKNRRGKERKKRKNRWDRANEETENGPRDRRRRRRSDGGDREMEGRWRDERGRDDRRRSREDRMREDRGRSHSPMMRRGGGFRDLPPGWDPRDRPPMFPDGPRDRPPMHPNDFRDRPPMHPDDHRDRRPDDLRDRPMRPDDHPFPPYPPRPHPRFLPPFGHPHPYPYPPPAYPYPPPGYPLFYPPLPTHLNPIRKGKPPKSGEDDEEVKEEEEEEGSDQEDKEPLPDRAHIDMTPIDVPYVDVPLPEVDIYIPSFFSDMYPEHPHTGLNKADPDQALLELQVRASVHNSQPPSLHQTATTQSLLIPDPKEPIDWDKYPSLKSIVRPVVKKDQLFTFIGKGHRLNVLWNWDPKGAQNIKNLDDLPSLVPMFHDRLMDAAQEIEKKEVVLLSECQLRVRALLLEEHPEEQIKYLLKKGIFAEKDFPNFDFSFMREKKPAAKKEESDEVVEFNRAPTKVEILELGLKGLLETDCRLKGIVKDKETAKASVGVLSGLVKKLSHHLQYHKETLEGSRAVALSRILGRLKSLRLLERILDVYREDTKPAPVESIDDKVATAISSYRNNIVQGAKYSNFVSSAGTVPPPPPLEENEREEEERDESEQRHERRGRRGRRHDEERFHGDERERYHDNERERFHEEERERYEEFYRGYYGHFPDGHFPDYYEHRQFRGEGYYAK
eukprot:sb/3461688/